MAKEIDEQELRKLLGQEGEPVSKIDFYFKPEKAKLEGVLTPLANGAYEFSGTFKYKNRVFKVDKGILKQSEDGDEYVLSLKGARLDFDDTVGEASKQELKKFFETERASIPKKLGRMSGRAYFVGGESFFISDNGDLAKGVEAGIVSLGYKVRSSEDGKIPGVVILGGKVFKTEHGGESLLVTHNGDFIRGSGVTLFEGGYYGVWASSDGKVPGIAKFGDKEYKTRLPGESLLINPKGELVGRGYTAGVTSEGFYELESSRDGKIPAVLMLNGKEIKTERPGESLLVSPNGNLIARGSRIKHVLDYYIIEAGAGIPAIVRIGDKVLQTTEPGSGFKIVKQGENLYKIEQVEESDYDIKKIEKALEMYETKEPPEEYKKREPLKEYASE
ncbi:hypothetical protein J7L02_02110 [Candidatus Woesearchaeota archaeon]|nr:hypothetical protein [Candidatus Woesearchaeota archaeon]